MRRIMIDIETLGTEPGCVVLSIGAIQFGPERMDGDGFYATIDPTDAQERGLTVDAGTVEWWMEQSGAAQAAAFQGDEELSEALLGLTEYIDPQSGPFEVWAKSPDFDCKILEAAYDQTILECPWSYDQTRCVRTATSLVTPTPQSDDGQIAHHALHDARKQAREVASCLRQLEHDLP